MLKAKPISRSGEAPSADEITAAHMAGQAFHSRTMGVFPFEWNGIKVEYHASTNIAFTTPNDEGAYFGYASAVQMRCWCRGVHVIEISAGPDKRTGVFLSDGTELATVPISTIPGYTRNTPQVFGNVIVAGEAWSGGDFVDLYDVTNVSGSVITAGSYRGKLEFTVPDDACFNVPVKPGSSGNIGPLQLANQFTAPGSDHGGLSVSDDARFLADYAAGYAVAINRERARRKKCSDGQAMYLRNGFLPSEFEYFIKTLHPRSSLLKRSIPMEIVSTSYLLSSDTNDGITRARTYTAQVILKYTEVDADGNSVHHQHQFDGSILRETITHTGVAPTTGTVTTNRYTYTDLPMLKDLTGKSYTLPSPLPEVPYSTIFKYDATDALWHDDATFPLMLIANGEFTTNTSIATDQYNSPNFVQGSYSPALPVSSDNTTLTTPQFLLDYINASKPVEIKEGETASTNWLSSRLADKEIITIIPLSFITAAGDDRGMFPINRTDEVPTQIKVNGYGRFKFDYFTGTSSFVDWSEFTDQGIVKVTGDNYEYNDEINPTQLTVRDSNGNPTTYSLTPRLFDYNVAWATPNCVCIAGKTPWTDTKASLKTQKSHLSDDPPAGYTLTVEELLYKAVKEAIK